MVAGLANAASPGQVPDAALASFGLSGMQQMTDVQGTNIRGMGTYAYVYGGGVANALGGTSQYNAYGAGANHFFGSSTAVGVSGSLAVSGGALITPGGTFAIVTGGLAVGGGYAYAK
jgi:hypothetical protein